MCVFVCQTLKPCGGGDSIDFICLVKGLLGRVCQLLASKSSLIREGELAAFLSYAIAYPQNFLPVIDSYSVRWWDDSNYCNSFISSGIGLCVVVLLLEYILSAASVHYCIMCCSSGLLCFCAVALALFELQYRPLGVRLDSGDLCRQSLEVRRVFRECSKQWDAHVILILIHIIILLWLSVIYVLLLYSFIF